jgi:CRISPR-associated protein Csd1
MGLLQKACETYDTHQDLVGKYIAEHQPLAPISHIVVNADIEITVNQDGLFQSARAIDKSKSATIIPVTMKSEGRVSNTIAPHPLCDQLKYIAPYDQNRYSKYLEQLSEWIESEYNHPKLMPILRYVKSGSILQDLSWCKLVKLTDSGVPKDDKQAKKLVRWCVVGLDDWGEEDCWKDQTLFSAYISYYKSKTLDWKQDFCLITGKYSIFPEIHPRGLFSNPFGAKLISSNDKDGYTFRGRFTDAQQAATVSYEASQKAHNAIRWLIADQGVRPIFGEPVFICWNPQGKPVPPTTSPLRRRNVPQTVQVTPSDYRKELALALASYQYELPEGKDDVVIASFDAATTGRLSLTYYNELRGSDFLQRLYDWDDTCRWYSRYGIQSPALFDIVKFAFGTLQKSKGKVEFKIDKKVVGMQMRRLVSCRVDKMHMPEDIEQALVQKASRLYLYEDEEKSGYLRSNLLSTTCAVIWKYRYDNYMEEWSMSLEPKSQDRNYQFGRLLAVLEVAERKAYKDDEKREPNAIRMQAAFSQSPLHSSRVIWEQVKVAYFPDLDLGSRIYYDRLMSEIVEQLSQHSVEELNQPLGDTYLLGYYLQRNELYKSKKEKEMEDQQNECTTEKN